MGNVFSNLLTNCNYKNIVFTWFVFVMVINLSFTLLVNANEFPIAYDYTYVGSTTTKWEPGENSASIHNINAPAGPMTPGAASWSAMPSGVVSSNFDSHNNYPTTDIDYLITDGGDGFEYDIFNSAFNIWSSVANIINLGQVSDSGLPIAHIMAHPDTNLAGDIRVAGINMDGVNGTLAHGFQCGTNSEFGHSVGGDIHFDTSENWVDDPFDISGNGRYDFYTVALHELGHALGLGHSNVSGSVMWAYYTGSSRQLQSDDIAGIQALYGVVPEPATLSLFSVGLLCGIKRSKQRPI